MPSLRLGPEFFVVSDLASGMISRKSNCLRAAIHLSARSATGNTAGQLVISQSWQPADAVP